MARELQFLRRRVAELEEAAAARDDASRLNERSLALVERVKELKCLYAIPHLLREPQAELGDILQKIVDVLPSAWRYPELACASVALGNRVFRTRAFREPRWLQTAEIPMTDGRAGRIEIGYAEPLPDGREPGFLPEEQTLLSTVAERVAEIVALKETQKKVESYEGHLRSLASELTLAEERERRSLALSLHDRIGQALAVAKLKLETLAQLLPDGHRARLEDISTLIKQIVNDTRSLTFEISPPILYELGLRQAVVWLGDHFARQFGLRVEVRSEDELPDLPEGSRVMLFRSVQELLTNTVKHACASRATVALRSDGGDACILVEDDGAGFDADSRSRYPPATGGFGLFSIRERIAHLGGRVEIDSSPDRGARILLRVPGRAAGTGKGER